MTRDWEGGTLEESGKLDNPDYYCEHGTFIGDPYGPDYMCWACEEGLTMEEWNEYRKREAEWERRIARRDRRIRQLGYNVSHLLDHYGLKGEGRTGAERFRRDAIVGGIVAAYQRTERGLG